MKTIRLMNLIMFGGGLLVAGSRSLAQNRRLLPNNPEQAWAEVEKVHEALRRPGEWEARKPTDEEVAKFQRQIRESARSFADKAREFIQRFPADENVGDAR